MSIFSKVSRLVGKASRIPGVKQVARAVPFVGTALAAYEGIQLVNDITGGAAGKALGFGGSAPSTPAGLPLVTPGSTEIPMGSTSGPGLLPRGPGGALQWWWNDPNIPEYLKKFAIDDGYLKVAVRAPKGYVVLRDKEGRPFGVNKEIAKAFKIWRPKKRPPISVTDWQALKKAHSTVTKLKGVVKMSKVVSMPKQPRRKALPAPKAA